MRNLSISALGLLLVGCGDRGDEGRGSAEDGILSLDDDSAGSSSGGGSAEGQKLDLNQGTGTEGDEGVEEGCKKVDLLFVIDTSGSMEDEQVILVGSFPDFIDEILTELGDTEGYHIGITTTDAYIYNGANCTVEGALVTQTGGLGSSGSTCGPYVEGGNFMTEMDDLAAEFACAAQVGIGGDGNERPGQTLTAAVQPGINGQGQCNAGFLRDDALLVVVIITDEEDDHEVDGCMQLPQPGSAGNPADWYAAVVDAKNGLEQNIVVLSLIGPIGPDPAICPTLDKCNGGIIGADPSPRLQNFTEMFTNGFVGRICEDSYQEFFHEAVMGIKSACDGWVPPP